MYLLQVRSVHLLQRVQSTQTSSALISKMEANVNIALKNGRTAYDMIDLYELFIENRI